MNYTVSLIKKLKGGKYQVTFENLEDNQQRVHIMPEDIVLEYKVIEGQSYSEENLEGMISHNDKVMAKEKAMRVISFAPKSKKQIQVTLKKEGYGQGAIEETLDFLEEYQFVDDKKMAESIWKDLTENKKNSKRQAVMKLAEKGISKEIIRELTQELDPELEYENAKELAEKKFASLRNKPLAERLQKTSYSLSYKGFSYNAIKKAMEEIKKNSGEEEDLDSLN